MKKRNQWSLNSQSLRLRGQNLSLEKKKERSTDRSASLLGVQSSVKTPFGGYEKPHPKEVHHLSGLLLARAYEEHFSKWTRRVVLKAVFALASRDVSPRL